MGWLENIGKGITDTVSKIGKWVGGGLDTIWKAITELKNGIANIGDGLKKIWDELTKLGNKITNDIANVTKYIATEIAKIPTLITTTVTNTFWSIFNGALNIIQPSKKEIDKNWEEAIKPHWE